jgi:hypothetical protein
MLDFLIYLSPADVWTGTLKYDAEYDGPMLYSDDDSILSDFNFEDNVGIFGDEEPAKRNLYTPNSMKNLVGYDYAELGYAYVINVATWDAGGRPVDKKDIVDAYEPFNGVKGVDVQTELGLDYPDNVLAGWMDLQVGDYGVATLNAVTLKGYKNLTKIVPQTETILAPTGTDESGGSSDTLLKEIEFALAKQHIAMPYLNSDAGEFSTHMFTFPTKYTDIDSVEAYLDDNTQQIAVRSPWPGFVENNDSSAEYTGFLYDLKENTIAEETPIWSPAPPEGDPNTFPHELNLRFTSGGPFSEGWMNYDFNEVYAPVIPVSLDFTLDGMSFKYGAWTETTLVEPYYPVTD